MIEELIADSKKRKIERIKDNEEIVELTKKLDENWKNLIPLVGKLTKGDEVKQKPDDYDRKMREMIFERRGAPAEKLKSEEHLAQKEKDRLEKLEKDRLNRMRGEIESDTKKSHRSADDLDDDYFYEEVDEDEVQEPERMIAYEINEKKDDDNDEENEDEEDDGGDEEQEDEEDEKPVNKSKKLLSKDENENVDAEESEEEESGDDDDGSEEGESEDDFSDLKVDDDTDDYEVEKPINGKAPVEIKLNGEKPVEPLNAVDKKEIMDKAAKELPYTFIVPENYDSFLKLLQTHDNPSLQAIIVERMLKSNHPRLSNTNYGKVATMFAYILQYLNDVFSDVDCIEDLQNAFKLLSQLTPHLFDISQLNNVSTGKCFQQVIIEKYGDFKDGNQKMYPDLDIIIYFKLVSVLYSTSDFRHPIVTPTICFINHILSRCPIRTCSDIATGLLLTTYIHEYSQLSCRLLPSALNFLNGCLTLCVPKKSIEVVRLIPPFKSPSLLVLEERTKKSLNRWNDEKNFDSKIQSKDLLKTAIIDEDFKIRAMNVTLGLIYDFMQLLSENSGIIYLVMPFIENIEKLECNLNSYPNAIQQHITNISNLIAKIQEEKKLQYLVAKERKPKPLRMLEPRVVQVYDGGRKHHSSEAKAQREKMLYKIRRETKGAMREIRKDNEFLSKLQLKKRIQRYVASFIYFETDFINHFIYLSPFAVMLKEKLKSIGYSPKHRPSRVNSRHSIVRRNIKTNCSYIKDYVITFVSLHIFDLKKI